jgi:hypothetical protein
MSVSDCQPQSPLGSNASLAANTASIGYPIIGSGLETSRPTTLTPGPRGTAGGDSLVWHPLGPRG